jgi:DNA mismatch repair protein MutS
MMVQYQALKDLNPDALLFFRLGDFYELFGEDAKEASRLLGLTLTARSSGEGRTIKVPMAGIPYHSAPTYIQKLLRLGKRIAVCEQVEDPANPKGPMRRELVRVITPGTALDEGYLDSGSNNYVAALAPGKNGLGLAWADNATGEFQAMRLEPGTPGLEAELARLRPSECVCPQDNLDPALRTTLEESRVLLSWHEAWAFDAGEAARALKQHFGLATLQGFGLEEGSPECAAAGALLAYLLRTQRSSLVHLFGVKLYQANEHLRLDAAAQRHLELVENQEDGSSAHTLFSTVDRTVSAAGSRRLKQWLRSPLLDLEAIESRHNAVGILGPDPSMREANLRGDLQALLRACTDVERLMGRIGCLAAGPRDLASLRQTLRQLPAIQALLKPRGGLLQAPSDDFSTLCRRLENAIVEDPPALLRDGGFIKPGFDAELDEAVGDSTGGREKVLAVQEKERARSGNPKLKVQFNNVFGYYIEVSKAQADGVPADYERKQTLVNAERFTTPELKVIEQRVLTAEDRRKARELMLFEGLRQEVAAQAKPLLALASRLSEWDALAALAETASREAWVRPDLDSSQVLDIKEGRHPVVEVLLRREGASFTPNDCLLDTDTQQLMLITGPNMAGKSTYMRQQALLVVLAQAGSFVPATSMRLGLVDQVFTRVGASDKQSRGLSTFLVEMTETANILRHATRRSLVVMDEIGRGTSTYDGVSIAWSVAEYLHDAKHLGCRSLFATHYFELAELEKRLPRVRNYSVAVREWQGKIVFLHSVRPGSSEHSYGVAVARLAGVPEAVLQRAKEVLSGLELRSRPAALAPQNTADQMNLFAKSSADPSEQTVLEDLRALETESMTPLQALQTLHDIKQRLLPEGTV